MAPLRFYLNGKQIIEPHPEPENTLAWYIREKLGLTGTKISCGGGVCGSCTVVLGRLENGKPKFGAVNSCLMPLGLVHDCAVITVEGIGNVRSKLHPIQERLSRGHGSQCGFCSPGMVMSMYALLRNSPQPTLHQIERALEGNLCRCTGYRPILESFGSFSKEFGCGRKDCCQLKEGAASGGVQPADAAGGGENAVPVNWSSFAPYDPTQEPIFPPQLLVNKDADDLIEFNGSRIRFFLPKNLSSLWTLMKEHPTARLISAGTWIGLKERYEGQVSHPVWISLREVKDIQSYSVDGDGFTAGAGLTIAQLLSAIHQSLDGKPAAEMTVLRGFLESIERLGGEQHKNLMSWVGNFASGRSISDLCVAMIAARAQIRVQNGSSDDWQLVTENLFDNTKQALTLPSGSVITAFRIPPSTSDDLMISYKQGDGGAVAYQLTAAFSVKFAADSTAVERGVFAFGGVAIAPRTANKLAEYVVGKTLSREVFESMGKILLDEIGVGVNKEKKSEFRNALCLSFLFKFFLSVQKWYNLHRGGVDIDAREVSVVDPPPFQPMESTQIFKDVGEGQSLDDPVGRAVPNHFSDKQVSGDAIYTMDIPAQNALVLVPLMSSRCKAKILNVDTSAALALEGVETYVDLRDIPIGGSNILSGGAENLGEPADGIFANGEVMSVGQIIGGIVAVDEPTARRAIHLIKVEYEDLPNPVLNIKDAVAAESFIFQPMINQYGDVEAGFKESDHVVEGEVKMGGQEHFYMETHSACAVPGEGNAWTIHTTTQSPKDVHRQVSKVLGNVPYHDIVVKNIRLGGAFGAKCSQNYALWPALIAANKLRKPVRCGLSRREDLIGTGKRHPMYATYKAGFTKAGKVKALDVQLFMEGGHTADQSWAVMMLAVIRFGNCYHVPNFRIFGRACRTNTPSNTAFRAYGTPQGYYATEMALAAVAEKLGLSMEKVRELNFVKPGDRTMQNTIVKPDDMSLQRCWEECGRIAQYDEQLKAVAEFNKQNRYRKRGVSMVPCRWGIGMAGNGFEQGAVLVHIYLDGSVLVSHGGVEMGQGLNTKVLQVAARTLKLPIERITIAENSTDKVPNPTTTGGSQGSDVQGLATLNACEELMRRLLPIREENPKLSWDELVNKANADRVNLSATGIGRPPFDVEKDTIRYYTTGVACTQVEIDTLTGDHKNLKTDIVMDVGDSLNPMIDIGQIEGGFMQGYGLYTCEEMPFDQKTGEMLTGNAQKYRIPKVDDVPRQFRVALLKGNPETHNLFSSRGIGEPPVYLGISGYMAIREAVKAARVDSGLTPEYAPKLRSPATAERIRLACGPTLPAA